MSAIRSGSLLLIGSLLLGACATVPAGPSVMALPGAGKPFDAFQGDDLVCRQWAAQQAGTTPDRAAGLTTAENAGIGTLLGAGLGAAIGALGHAPGLGAAVGAGAGLVTGSAFGASAGQRAAGDVQHRYDAAYEQCMYAKGNRVPAGAPAPAASIPPPPPPR
jgi:Glycine-zipper domain